MTATEQSTRDYDANAILGRSEMDDVDKILAVPLVDPDSTSYITTGMRESMFTWDYDTVRPGLHKLYEKAKTGQWNGTTDLPWETDVDIEKVIGEDMEILGVGLQREAYAETAVGRWGPKEWLQFNIESRNWTLSQFLHGEQGAVLCTAKIAETVPWHDAKMYASTQVVDEARHVEVFARYLKEKMGGQFPINPHVLMVLEDILTDTRWDMTYLGMQVMFEGLALAAFGFIHQFTNEPLLKKLLRYVMSDEARHVAFGVLSLKEAYEGMSDAEMRDRQEFAFEVAVRMRDRFMQQEVWMRMGVDPKDVLPIVLRDPTRQVFNQMLFSKIVPNCKKLGLLDRNDSWLRHRFEEMGVIQFENWENTGEEYLKFDLSESID